MENVEYIEAESKKVQMRRLSRLRLSKRLRWRWLRRPSDADLEEEEEIHLAK